MTSATACCCCASPTRCCTPWPRASSAPARRRSLAGRLRDAPADHVDIVRRATWEDAAGGEPNVELLLAAADAVLLNDAAAAVRLATRALQAGGGIPAVTMLSAAQSELGRPDLARATLDEAAAATGADRRRGSRSPPRS